VGVPVATDVIFEHQVRDVATKEQRAAKPTRAKESQRDTTTMGQGQTKMHWAVLSQDWERVLRRLQKQPKEAATSNPYGDHPLHLACYEGQAPPYIIRALISAYPDAVRLENKMGRDPLELASINYRVGGPHRSELLALLRWHRPGSSPPQNNENDNFDNEESSTFPSYADMFVEQPPLQMYNTSNKCVICLECPASIAMVPCGHVCLCVQCLQPKVMSKGICPIDRCEVVGLYKVKDNDVIHGKLQRLDSGRALIAN
jgi:hypothetical protein